MGLFDLPSPAFNMLDSYMAYVLPDLVRLIIWTILAVGLGMLLYRRFIAHRDASAGIAAIPLIISLLPTAFVAVWLCNVYEYEQPEAGTKINMEIHSISSVDASGNKSKPVPKVDKFKKAWPIASGKLVYQDTVLSVGSELPASPTVGVVAKKQWWNALFGNPVGYIPQDFAIQKITFDIPNRKMVPVNSYWISNWKLWFLLALGGSFYAFRKIFQKD